MGYKLISHPLHNCESEAAADPIMRLPLSDMGMTVVSSAHAVEELLIYRTKRANF